MKPHYFAGNMFNLIINTTEKLEIPTFRWVSNEEVVGECGVLPINFTIDDEGSIIRGWLEAEREMSAGSTETSFTIIARRLCPRPLGISVHSIWFDTVKYSQSRPLYPTLLRER